MKIFLLTFILSYIFVSIAATGLSEEFTWTRITYTHLQRRTRQARYRGNNRYTSQNQNVDDIQFPGAINTGNNNNNNNNNNGGTNSRRPTSTTPTVPTSSSATTQEYIHENNIPMGANVWGNKLFITVPRRRNGVPSSLNYVWLNSTNRHNVPLIPYPDLQTNSLSNSDGIVSVYRVAIDSCNLLWFIDTGTIEVLGNPQVIRRPTLTVIDLMTDRIIRRHEFEEGVLRPATSLAAITVDHVDGTCDGDTFAYVPDLSGYGMIVYNYRENRAWRVTHNYFFLEPMAGEFTIAGHQFQWNDGIFSIALSKIKSDGYRDAYFHSMAGTHLYRVSTRVLRDEALATRSYHGDDFEVVGDRGKLSQTSTSDLHQPSNVLFLALVNQNALGCWNTGTPLQDISIIQRDDQKMIYPSDVKVQGDKIIVLTNTMPEFLYGRLNYDQTNFRVWIETVQKAVEGTKCAGRRSTHRY